MESRSRKSKKTKREKSSKRKLETIVRLVDVQRYGDVRLHKYEVVSPQPETDSWGSQVIFYSYVFPHHTEKQCTGSLFTPEERMLWDGISMECSTIMSAGKSVSDIYFLKLKEKLFNSFSQEAARQTYKIESNLTHVTEREKRILEAYLYSAYQRSYNHFFTIGPIITEELLRDINALVLGAKISPFRSDHEKVLVNGTYPPTENIPEIVRDLTAFLNSPRYLVFEPVDKKDGYYRVKPVKDSLRRLERALLAHIKTCLIHPFRDGNGRTARILQIALLNNAGLLPYDVPLDRREEYLNLFEQFTSSPIYSIAKNYFSFVGRMHRAGKLGKELMQLIPSDFIQRPNPVSSYIITNYLKPFEEERALYSFLLFVAAYEYLKLFEGIINATSKNVKINTKQLRRIYNQLKKHLEIN